MAVLPALDDMLTVPCADTNGDTLEVMWHPKHACRITCHENLNEKRHGVVVLDTKGALAVAVNLIGRCVPPTEKDRITAQIRMLLQGVM